MESMRITINGVDVQAPAGSTILEAARLVDVDIPTLCYLKDVNEIGACRLCVVEVKGAKGLVASCVTRISPDMEIWTDTPKVVESRRMSLDLICSKHRMDCEYCVRSSDCELHALVRAYGLDDKKYGYIHEPDIDDSAIDLIMDKSKCVLCRRCVAVCRENQHVGVFGVFERGFETYVGTALPLADTACIHCGQCITVCPTDALTERDDTRNVWRAINNPSKHVVAAISPFVGAQLGECFLDPVGNNGKGKMVASLRRLGFDRVFDVEDAAAAVVTEVGTELLERSKNGAQMPMVSSNCPSWVKFCEICYPELLEKVSASKSPPQMLGALVKSRYAEKTGIDPRDIFVVSITPCTAEKVECQRSEMVTKGHPNVDVSLTTRELVAMIRRACVSNYTSLKVWRELPDEVCDPFPNLASETGHIFSANGGLMEATLGTAHKAVTGKALPSLNFAAASSDKDIQEAEVSLYGSKVRVATVTGLANAAKLLDMVKSGEKEYTFIEVMACPGGCLNGGGQPHQPGSVHNFTDLKAERARALRSSDEANLLKFDPANYTERTSTVGSQTIKYHAYENIVYVANPVDTEYQVLNVFVPESYARDESINGYTAETAPIFFPNEVEGYLPARPGSPGAKARQGPGIPEEIRVTDDPNAAFVALSKGYVVVSPGARGRTTQDKNGRYTGKAPAPIVDLKAAVRYVRHNDYIMPGDAEKIISNGTSAGGALSSLLGSTGNHPDYEPHLKALGAANERDDIFATSCYCPTTNLDNLDLVHEWQFHGIHNYGDRTLTAEQIKLSNELNAQFPAYLNDLGLKDGDGTALTLDEDGDGIFRDYVQSFLIASAQRALDAGAAVSGLSWVTVQDGTVTDVDFYEAFRHAGRVKPVPAFDWTDLGSRENSLFGTETIGLQHFSRFSKEHSTADGCLADPIIVKMMNPMNYIGADGSGTAPHWRLRIGSKDAMVANNAILTAKLRSEGLDVDSAVAWDVDHGGDYDLDELFAWIDLLTKR